jgi:hypothetical protein
MGIDASMFFFEKKNQKTLAKIGQALSGRPGFQASACRGTRGWAVCGTPPRRL